MKHAFPLIAVFLAIAIGILVLFQEVSKSPVESALPEPPPGELVEVARPSAASEVKTEPAPEGRSVVSVVEGKLVSGSATQISGIVVDHLDRPVKGAICEVLEGTAPAGLTGVLSRKPPARRRIVSMRSGSNGAFSLDVPPGFWTLRVVGEGHAPWEEGSLRPGDFRWVRLRPSRAVTILVRNTDGRAIEGAEVRLLRSKWGDTRQARQVVVTNVIGAALLESVASGSWFVHVSHQEYIAAVDKLPVDWSVRQFEVELESGIRVVGRVVTDGGQPPLAGTQVLFETGTGLISSHATQCDADGRYSSRVAFETPQTIEVAVLSPGYGESRREVRLGVPDASGVHREDFVLETVDRTVFGRVVDLAGLPLEGTEVFVQPLLALPPEGAIAIPSSAEIIKSGLPSLSVFDPETSKVSRLRPAGETDVTGLFRVSGLHPRKSYNLVLISPKHSNASLWIEVAQPGTATDLGTIKLNPAGRIWGHVRLPDGGALEGARVTTVSSSSITVKPDTVFQTKRPNALIAGLESITGDSGFFSFEPFPECEFRLMCNGTLFGPFTMPAGGELGTLELVTKDVRHKDPARAIPVLFSVVDTVGAPVPRSHVTMSRTPSAEEVPGAFFYGDWLWQAGNAEGQIELNAWEEGTYEVEIKDLQGLLASQSFRVQLTTDGLRRGVILSVDPVPSAPLEGVVVSSTGEALAGMVVTLIPQMGKLSCDCMKFTVQTDASGTFSFGHFMRGAHRLLVTDPTQRFSPGRYYPAQPGVQLVVRLE